MILKQKNFYLLQQDACTTSSDTTMMGTCMTETECADKSGSVDGNCASGFGVCCMFTAVCGTTTSVSQNCTYLQNAEYPSTASASTTCSYTFERICNSKNSTFRYFLKFYAIPDFFSRSLSSEVCETMFLFVGIK